MEEVIEQLAHHYVEAIEWVADGFGPTGAIFVLAPTYVWLLVKQLVAADVLPALISPGVFVGVNGVMYDGAGFDAAPAVTGGLLAACLVLLIANLNGRDRNQQPAECKCAAVAHQGGEPIVERVPDAFGGNKIQLGDETKPGDE